MTAAAFSGRPSVSAMTTLTLQPSTPPAALRSSSAINIASRIASPPTTVPGADRGGEPTDGGLALGERRRAGSEADGRCRGHDCAQDWLLHRNVSWRKSESGSPRRDRFEAGRRRAEGERMLTSRSPPGNEAAYARRNRGGVRVSGANSVGSKQSVRCCSATGRAACSRPTEECFGAAFCRNYARVERREYDAFRRAGRPPASVPATVEWL